ncbi:MAG: response regulator [Kofleriaceae bacterium]|nr:response regulator [Myxococcales bacterium]MCB9564987.1 response regulator [Kofleriaceae bacterium]MCB9574584.1 response regulator [Kofleriaceae bacterium]
MTDDQELAALRRRVEQLEDQLREVAADHTALRRVLDSIPAVVLRVGLDGMIEYVNRVLPEYALRPPVGQSIYSYAPPDQHELMRAAIDEAVRTGDDASFESLALAPDGTRDWYHTIVAAVREGDEAIGVIMTCSSITRLKEVERALRESRERVALALDAGNVGVWRWDRRIDHVDWDDKLCSMFGVAPQDAPSTAEAFLALISEDQRDAMRAHIEASVASGTYADFELRVDTPDGVRWFVIKGGVIRDDGGAVVGLLGGVVDDTERRRLMEHVRESQKLEAMGQLAAGVAHNFNNMLAGIVPVVELAARDARPPLDELLAEARQSALRAAELVKSLMLVSRREPTGTARPREALAVVIERAVQLCRRTFSRQITIETGDLSAAASTPVDAVQLEQALLNLLLNARDALENVASTRARITVTATRVELGGATGAPKAAVEVRVRDHGAGMDEATRSRVFEPFFTTKPVGAGTGLGLTTAWTTIKAHGGTLTCESTPGVGTTFAFQLPIAEVADDAHADASVSDRTPSSDACVLVIDDDDTVCRATAAGLASEGYRVVTASSGEDGVRLSATHDVDVVVLDYSMPGLGPKATLELLRTRRPALPVILYSGLAAHLDGASAHVAKPATSEHLRAEIRRVLGR